MSDELSPLMVQEVNDHTYSDRDRRCRLKVFSRFVLFSALGDEPLGDVGFGSDSAPIERLCLVDAALSRPPEAEGEEKTDRKYQLARSLTHRAKRIRLANRIQEGGSR